MGLLGDLFSPFAEIPTAAVNLFNGIMGANSQSNINSANIANSQAQRDFELATSGSAHQREVADLQAAGLNPILSANHTGASTPTYQLPQLQSPYMAGINAASGGANMRLTDTSAAKARQETQTEEARTSVERNAAVQADFVTANFERLLRSRVMTAEYKTEVAEQDVLKAKQDVINLAKRGKLMDEDTAQVQIENVLKRNGIPESKAFADFFASKLGHAVPYARELEGVASSAAKATAIGAGVSAAKSARQIRNYVIEGK